MNLYESTRMGRAYFVPFPVVSWLVLSCLFILSISCSKSQTGGIDILGPADETTDAGKIVEQANEDLTKIKRLYKENESKREELKKAMESNDATTVKKISDDVVYAINDGAAFGQTAVEKIRQAQEMNVNADYREYLRLKEEALTKQLEAFENYRQAARMLRDNYDPKNKELREKVTLEFKTRGENYQKIMETARDYSTRANALAKEVINRKQ
jgi:uncharacterized protein YqiB (DUF1249 family)